MSNSINSLEYVTKYEMFKQLDELERKLKEQWYDNLEQQEEWFSQREQMLTNTIEQMQKENTKLKEFVAQLMDEVQMMQHPHKLRKVSAYP
jgi:hypothetical protein